MMLRDLIVDLDIVRVKGSLDVAVRDITCRSQDVANGHCFVALSGTKIDGHAYIDDALKNGASAIVSERAIDNDGVANVIVNDARLALASISARHFNDPSAEMKLVGITGTNGKTTTTYLIEAIIRECGGNPGVIGTISYKYAGLEEAAPNTTPQSYDLQKLFRKMRDLGVDSCAMEVSSHALVQQRAAKCRFDCAVFTNLTPEHLDYHRDMDDYFAAKRILFDELLPRDGKQGACAIVNVDDKYGAALARSCRSKVLTYGFADGADVRGSDLRFDGAGLVMEIKTPTGPFECRSQLVGKFNAMNILAATATAISLGFGIDRIRSALLKVESVPGRFETVKNGRGILAIVDYAHKPDALENVLSCAREIIEKRGGRLIVVFGCGGDRDRQKRPLMGSAAGRLADVAIITSDNPRTEVPSAIIEEILPGIRDVAVPFDGERGFEVIEDRRSAIARAVSIAKSGDLIIVAGKGHEDYQIIGDRKIHFDDREVLGELLS